MFMAVVDVGGFGEAVGAYGICPADRTEVQQRFFPEFAVIQDKLVARLFRHHRLLERAFSQITVRKAVFQCQAGGGDKRL